MGKICEISCQCGYTKKLYIGEGLAACNINMVNVVFPEETLKSFNNYYRNKEIKSFFTENKLSFCDRCKEIMTVAVLTVELTSGKKIKFINGCTKCGNKVRILDNLSLCPKCGKKIIKRDIGHWD